MPDTSSIFEVYGDTIHFTIHLASSKIPEAPEARLSVYDHFALLFNTVLVPLPIYLNILLVAPHNNPPVATPIAVFTKSGLPVVSVS